MKWKSAFNEKDNIYELPGNWLKVHYFEALNVLFRFENSLRLFVFIVLKDVFHEGWKNINLKNDEDSEGTINNIAKKRIEQDNKFAYLGYNSNNPIMYLTSGELINLITSTNYWKYFKPFFKGSKDIMKNKLDEIGNVRNSLAHFRPITDGDVDLIKQNVKHTMTYIEELLCDIINCDDIVPTNTNEHWYKTLSSIKNEYLTIVFQQSKDTDWIKASLLFTPPILDIMDYHDINSKLIRTVKFGTESFLLKSSGLTNYLLASFENSYYHKQIDMQSPKLPPIIISLVFSRKTLIQKADSINKQLIEAFEIVKNEVELVKKDSLAQGEIISNQILKTLYSKEIKYWFISSNNSNDNRPKINNSPEEFWGKMDRLEPNFISNIKSFPWMSVDISEDKSLPF